MAFEPKKNDAPKTPAKREVATTTSDPISLAVDPVPVVVLDIPKDEPYPTGAPSGPVTWAEINGLVPVGTGPLDQRGFDMSQNVNRIQDVAVANVNEIVPKNWHRFPPRVGSMTPEYVRVLAYSGGVQGDDVDTATATLKYEPALGEASSYTPRTQAEKASTMVPAGSLAEDITRPRGWVEPDDPYTAKPGAGANPTITSLAPNTAVAGSPSPLAVVVTGTNFTPWSTLETGNVPSPYVKYESATKMTILMDPKRSSAGIVVVKVVDHGVKSAGTNFTYT